MARLNLTLDRDTWERLGEQARASGERRAGLARRLLREALNEREALERRRRVARDYAAGRKDATELIRELEAGQLELLHGDD
jgi:hypothetical protein